VIILGAGLLALIGISAFVIVRTDDVTHQMLGLAFYGLMFALLFFVFQAPDVALSQITVGAIALPLLIMLAITRMRHRKALRANQGQEHD
jgi:energy-converting hydrogenase B subunit D